MIDWPEAVLKQTKGGEISPGSMTPVQDHSTHPEEFSISHSGHLIA